MNLIEEWGSGIPKLMKAMNEYGLREPEFIDMDIALRINLYRSLDNENIKKTTQATQGTTQATQGTTQATQIRLTEEYKAVLAVIKKQPDITQREIAEKLCWKNDRVKYYISRLKKQNMVRRVGTSQNGYWELLVEVNAD